MGARFAAGQRAWRPVIANAYGLSIMAGILSYALMLVILRTDELARIKS